MRTIKVDIVLSPVDVGSSEYTSRNEFFVMHEADSSGFGTSVEESWHECLAGISGFSSTVLSLCLIEAEFDDTRFESSLHPYHLSKFKR